MVVCCPQKYYISFSISLWRWSLYASSIFSPFTSSERGKRKGSARHTHIDKQTTCLIPPHSLSLRLPLHQKGGRVRQKEQFPPAARSCQFFSRSLSLLLDSSPTRSVTNDIRYTILLV